VLHPGTRLGPYEIVSLLGAGGMGEVFGAHDSRLQRDVAIKVLPADVASAPDRDSGARRMPRAEWLSSHPNPGNRYAPINREASMLPVAGTANTGPGVRLSARASRTHGSVGPSLTTRFSVEILR